MSVPQTFVEILSELILSCKDQEGICFEWEVFGLTGTFCWFRDGSVSVEIAAANLFLFWVSRNEAIVDMSESNWQHPLYKCNGANHDMMEVLQLCY